MPSARGIIEATLARYGLGSLADWAWERWLDGQSMEQIMLDMRKTTTYKNRFPAMEQLGQEGRAISEEAYMQYEATIRQLTSQFGLPTSIYGSREYVAELLIADVSPVEAQSRMQLASAASLTAPPEYREQAAELFGISQSQWTSLWLETERTLPELERLFAATAIAGEATISDLGQLSSSMAERIADAGISREQARQQFTEVAGSLTARLPGEKQQGLGADTVAAGAVGLGTEARDLERRRRSRIAQFAGGGSFATTTQGATGLGGTGQ